MKLAARVGFEADCRDEVCGGESDCPQVWRNGEGTAGVVGLMPEVRIRGVAGVTGADAPFARPLVVTPLVDVIPFRTAGADVEVANVEVADPLTFVPVTAPVRCGEDDVASSPTRLRLLSAFGFSGTIFIIERAGVVPKLGDW